MQAALLPTELPKRLKGVDVAARFEPAYELGGDLFDALLNFAVDQPAIAESVARGINKARNDHRSKIEHKTIGKCHHGHVATHASGSTKKCDHLIFPRTAGKFHHVLRGGTDVIIIDRGRHDDSICFFNTRT